MNEMGEFIDQISAIEAACNASQISLLHIKNQWTIAMVTENGHETFRGSDASLQNALTLLLTQYKRSYSERADANQINVDMNRARVAKVERVLQI